MSYHSQKVKNVRLHLVQSDSSNLRLVAHLCGQIAQQTSHTPLLARMRVLLLIPVMVVIWR